MRFDFAMLADAAQVVQGKLYVQGGGLTRLTAPALPWMQPIAICMRLEAGSDEDLGRDLQLHLSVLGPADAKVVEHRIPLVLDRPDMEPAEGERPGLLLALTVSGLVVLQYGRHTVTLEVDGAEAELQFAVVAPPSVATS